MEYFDNHIHTCFSPDSKMDPAEIARKATALGLGGIAFTDHYDIGTPSLEGKFCFNPALQQQEIDKLRGKYPLEILKGIEVGLQPEYLKEIQQFMGTYEFDTVIASIHFVEGDDPYHGTYYRDKNYREAYNKVLGIMYSTAIQYPDFDIIGHFDYIVRYAPYPNAERNITLTEFGDYLEPLLKFLAETGKTLEINTKTYKQNLGYTPVLDLNILKRFRELGGEALSLGSDAHEYFRIGDNFDLYRELIKKCGFRYLVYYKKRKPHFYKI